MRAGLLSDKEMEMTALIPNPPNWYKWISIGLTVACMAFAGHVGMGVVAVVMIGGLVWLITLVPYIIFDETRRFYRNFRRRQS